jgi:hypothetical protein
VRRDQVLRAEQRRMALLALIASAWVLGAALLGGPEALGYLAPTLVLVGLLVLGRYPGERALARRAARPRALRPAPLLAPARARRILPRGGVLLASGLAGRAPPLPVG